MSSMPPNPATTPLSAFAFDVSIEDFEVKVLQASLQVPVVVDFWAPWCAPCQTLKPMLEKLAEEYKGRFLLAMVNADENGELAGHFGVRNIPSVKVVFQGQLVDEFNGALPEAQVREFLDRIALPAVEGEGVNLREAAAALLGEGKLEEALAKLVEASQANPQDQAVQLDAIDVLMQLGRNDEAAQLLAGEYKDEADRATALRARLALAQGAADSAPLEAKLAANPDDHATRLELARAYAAQSRFREALEAVLEVIRRDRFFDEGAPRKAMLQLFEALAGEQYDDLVREFRRKMSAALN
ncbi:tetratricopeptide repeat protein [Azonexus sp.]|uniref:tetratricopeptide repeat protein n=1 Tax=Azonexus sp. TaxID=1872668 RepID=UPI0027B9AE6F|nr:tetratricopeptide repeat protein [Azonexus sp.]